MRSIISILIVVFGMISSQAYGQKSEAAKTKLNAEILEGLKFRGIGPAFMSGRIADLAIDPKNENIWYVAAGSGGVWKTINAGTTFKPIFEHQSVYSTGCITIDPNDSHTIWLGTGENVGGRHVGFGDGIYKSVNGGQTWQNMGLKGSEHISKIIVHPENSDIIMVAVQGPLWSAGGERGFYKSADGGKSWTKTLGDDQYTGVTDMVYDPRNPNRVYAVTWEHHRTIAAWMGGGEKSRLYVSEDAGDSWTQLKEGLPDGKWGKTGLAISPQNPDVLYAAIELNRISGGVWRSENRGGSWTKMSDAVAGATGPHYYQELYASPHKFDRLYLMNNNLLQSEDGGKTFREMGMLDKHSDNHAVAFKASDPNYLLVGTDGGVYESFDLGTTWRFMENLPLTQFYKLAVDDAEPFYNIYGGTQDNSTEGGPSRTTNHHGIRNADWQVVLDWDGHQPATEPGNPDIMYGQRQEGYLARIDRKTGEVVDIMPQPGPEDDFERYNWDAPILVSPHNPTTIYHGSQRLWKSTNRGDLWTALSGDLTRNEERLAKPIAGGVQSWDSPWDVYAMSTFSTITSIAVSPKNEQLICIGTDDGLIQITEDEGQSWRKIPVSKLGVPARAYVNDIKADLFDENTFYVALDNHKEGDYQAYLVKTTDKGKSWQKISSGLGVKNLVWRIVQDHENDQLLFAGTEFGVYFSTDKGRNWLQLKGGMPTIPVRDLAIQRRENDLVAATFGRGFYVLDDYSALRQVNAEQVQETATLFTPRKAWWYIEKSILDFENARGSQGSQLFLAPNPDFGAVFTYYLKEEILSLEQIRQQKEKEGQINFPGWEALDSEYQELKPFVYLEIKDQAGAVVNRIKVINKKGFQRIAWDLKRAGTGIINASGQAVANYSFMVAPGNYTASLYAFHKGAIRELAGPVRVVVERLGEPAISGRSIKETVIFWEQYALLATDVNKLSLQVGKTKQYLKSLFQAGIAAGVENTVIERIASMIQEMEDVDKVLNGSPAKNDIGEKAKPSLMLRLDALNRGISMSSYGPTQTHLQTVSIIESQLAEIQSQVITLRREAKAIAQKIESDGGIYIEGMD